MVTSVLLGLLQDDGLSVATAVASAVAAHVDQRVSPYGKLLGPMRVPDTQLAAVGRCVGLADPLPVCVVNTTGAGGLVSLAARSVVEVDVVAVETALRDLDDLAGNAARVVVAAGELGDAVEVYVGVPYGPSAERALDVVEAAGLGCAVRLDEQVTTLELAGRLSALVELDVPFTTTGRASTPAALLVAVHALVEGRPASEAARLLSGDAPDATADAEIILGWDQRTAERVRRRLRLVGCPSVPDTVARLVASGLVSRA